MSTEADDLEHLEAVAAGAGQGSPFSELIEFLRRLDRRIRALEGLPGQVASLQEDVAFLKQQLPDDDTILAQRVAAVEEAIAEIEAAISSLFPGPAAQLAITIDSSGGTSPMPNGAISIDATTGKATLSFKDDKGDPTDPPASADGGPVTYALASSNPSVATFAADPADPTGLTFDVTPLAPGGATETAPGAGDWTPDGTVTVSASATDDQGAPANFADGQPIAGSAPFGVYPGAAAELGIAVG